jgi:precorrin-6B methylase 2
MFALLRKFVPPRMHPSYLARQRIIRKSGGSVMSGPFAGQIYITSKDDFIEPSMLLGVYEKELHPSIYSILRQPPALFIDIGASQGYYSVGFAKKVPQSRHISFELFEPRIQQAARTAAANGVRIEMWGAATPEALTRALAQSTDAFILSDIEGAEHQLLDPAAIPQLDTTRMIVETHDWLVPDTTEVLLSRFSKTHNIEIILEQKRSREDIPFLICDRWMLRQADEGRPHACKWLAMHPKQNF